MIDMVDEFFDNMTPEEKKKFWDKFEKKGA